jgi:hypothetical protein
MSSSLKVVLKVICIFIAHLLLISCVSPRITYSLTTADIRRNYMRSEFTLLTQSCDVRKWVDTNSCQLEKTQSAAGTSRHITQSGSLYFLNHIRGCACATRTRFRGTSNRVHLFVETATVATKDFRDPKRVKHACTSSSDFENAPADARMLEQRYGMYAPKILRGGSGAGDGGDCIDTGSVKHLGSKRASTFQEVFIAFMKRSSRMYSLTTLLMAIVVFIAFNNSCILLVLCRRICERFPGGEVKWLKLLETTMTRYLNAHVTMQLP